MQSELEAVIRAGINKVPTGGKIGKLLQFAVAAQLRDAGYDPDVEDTMSFLGAGLPVWRDKASGTIVLTRGRRLIDIVVRYKGSVVGLVEAESDLDDLRECGICKRSGHYDVDSITCDGRGRFFSSYKSLERMAAAAFYAAGGTPEQLIRVRSDASADHNPWGLPLILVTGRSRAVDRKILKPRCEALGARIISRVEV